MKNAGQECVSQPTHSTGKNPTCYLIYALHCSIIYNVIANFKLLVYLWVFYLEVLRKHTKHVWSPAMFNKKPAGSL